MLRNTRSLNIGNEAFVGDMTWRVYYWGCGVIECVSLDHVASLIGNVNVMRVERVR